VSWNLQKAIYDRLEDDSDISAEITGIYDHVPQVRDPSSDADYPYITIGVDTVNEFDTDEVLGFEARVEVHVWSRQRGRKQVKEIQDLIYKSLHRCELTIEDHIFISCDFNFSESFMDADALTRHGVQQFRILYEVDPDEPEE
jgi:hypothetical protein